MRLWREMVGNYHSAMNAVSRGVWAVVAAGLIAVVSAACGDSPVGVADARTSAIDSHSSDAMIAPVDAATFDAALCASGNPEWEESVSCMLGL